MKLSRDAALALATNDERLMRMRKSELAYLHELANDPDLPAGPIVELGTFAGSSTIMLAASGRQVVTIDNYGYDARITPTVVQNRLAEAGFQSWEACALCGRPHATGSVQVMRADSRLVPPGIEQVAMLFVDSSHEARHFAQEMSAWAYTLQNGSIVACHDYDSPRWPQMKGAIDGYLGQKYDKLGLVDKLIAYRVVK